MLEANIKYPPDGRSGSSGSFVLLYTILMVLPGDHLLPGFDS